MRLARTIRVVEGAKCSFSKLQDGLIDPSSVQHSGTVIGLQLLKDFVGFLLTSDI